MHISVLYVAKTVLQVSQLEGCVEVACGTAVSYAVTGAGKLYRWALQY